MKILFNCLTMEKGGAERVISLLANEFSKENDVVILTLKRSNDAYKLNPKIKRLKVDKTDYKKDGKIRNILRKISLVRLTKQRKKIISENPDIIISFLPEPSLRLMMIKKYSKRIKRIPTIISIRNDPEKEFSNLMLNRIMKKLYKNVDGMVFQTKEAQKYFDGIVVTNNEVIIQNPVDDSILEKPKSDKERRKVVINVGRLESQKNQVLLIEAFYDTLEKEKHGYVLEIYGEGSERRRLQSIIDGLKMEDSVFLKGQVDNIGEKLNDAKFFVLSSQYEGMSNALMEAMALGLPCISTDCPCGGSKMLIKDGENGLLVKNGNRKELGNAILSLISDGELRKKFSKNALKIRENNSVDKIVKQWRALIDKVVEAKE